MCALTQALVGCLCVCVLTQALDGCLCVCVFTQALVSGLCVCAHTSASRWFMCVCAHTSVRWLFMCLCAHTSASQKTAFNVSSLHLSDVRVPDVRLGSKSPFPVRHVTDPCIPLFSYFSLWSGLGRERAGLNLTLLNCWNCLRESLFPTFQESS